MAPTTRRERRPALTHERVVAAAVELADDQGIEALSMRKLAQALGVEAMSLYHHVANKDALLDGLVDLVFGEVQLPAPAGAAWRAPMRARMVSLHDALRRHPWATAVLESRTSPGAPSLHQHEACLAVLRAGGFSVRHALLAFAVLDAYVLGFAVQEQALVAYQSTVLAALEDADADCRLLAVNALDTALLIAPQTPPSSFFDSASRSSRAFSAAPCCFFASACWRPC